MGFLLNKVRHYKGRATLNIILMQAAKDKVLKTWSMVSNNELEQACSLWRGACELCRVYRFEQPICTNCPLYKHTRERCDFRPITLWGRILSNLIIHNSVWVSLLLKEASETCDHIIKKLRKKEKKWKKILSFLEP